MGSGPQRCLATPPGWHASWPLNPVLAVPSQPPRAYTAWLGGWQSSLMSRVQCGQRSLTWEFARLVKASRPVSRRMCTGAEPSNCANGKEAEFQGTCQGWDERARSLRKRREFVSLGFCTARTDKSWTCERGTLPVSTASGSVVRVFFCCGSVIGVRFAAALRACPRFQRQPAWSVHLFEALHRLGFWSRSRSSAPSSASAAAPPS